MYIVILKLSDNVPKVTYARRIIDCLKDPLISLRFVLYINYDISVILFNADTGQRWILV